MGYGTFIEVLTGDYECKEEDVQSLEKTFRNANIDLKLHCIDRIIQQKHRERLEEQCKKNGLTYPETGGGYDLTSLSQDNTWLIIPINVLMFLFEHREVIQSLIHYVLAKIKKYMDSQNRGSKEYIFNVEITDHEKEEKKLYSFRIESKDFTDESIVELTKTLSNKILS